MAHAARVTVDVHGDVAIGVAGALSVEAGAGLPKVAARVSSGKGGVTLGLEAEDAASLRAALNSFLRWADLAVKVAQSASPATDGPPKAKRGAAPKSFKRRR
jgi:tRNA threonylcarbamoyladenosine modification (KEOPS) complex  Pcc1 subunit